MTKPKLVLGFTDSFESIENFFVGVLSNTFEIVRDDKNPNYLIFCDENFGINNKTYDPKKTIKIFFTGENRRPWMYETHFAISFDHLVESWHYRLPLYVVDNYLYKKNLNIPDISDIVRNSTAEQKTGFCSFVVRNGACEERNRIFQKLMQYKKVDSAGPLFNNVGEILSREPDKFHTSKLDFLGTRKFNICYENSAYPGYVTEKLYHALYANTIPIYWGSPTVEIDFNADAFINRLNYNSDEEMIEHIIELDQNDDKYNRMLQKPILNPRNRFFDLDRFNHWFRTTVYRG